MTDPNPIRRRRVVTWDLWGWEAIADAICRSVSTTKRYAARDADQNPLPIGRCGGSTVARKSEIAEWAERENDSYASRVGSI